MDNAITFPKDIFNLIEVLYLVFERIINLQTVLTDVCGCSLTMQGFVLYSSSKVKFLFGWNLLLNMSFSEYLIVILANIFIWHIYFRLWTVIGSRKVTLKGPTRWSQWAIFTATVVGKQTDNNTIMWYYQKGKWTAPGEEVDLRKLFWEFLL